MKATYSASVGVADKTTVAATIQAGVGAWVRAKVTVTTSLYGCG